MTVQIARGHVNSSIIQTLQVRKSLRDRGLELEKGCRYIAWLPTDKQDIFHSVVVDETGTVFGPDPDNQDVRRSWTDYSFKAVLEFRPMN